MTEKLEKLHDGRLSALGSDIDLMEIVSSKTCVEDYEVTEGEDKEVVPDEILLERIVDKAAEEKHILRTIDRRMMPLFCIFYFVDFLDRANIGNASLGGIQDDIHMTSKELSTAISAFYITYIIFEVPSNVILKHTSAVMWLSLIMLLWGTMTLIMAFAKNFQSLLACRLLLGAAESGYIPGILYLMSKVYRPREFGLRIALLLCMSSISGIISGPLAYGTSFLEGQRGLHGWQYLFILEGVPTICLSVISYFYLFDDIQHVPWLTSEQKALHRHFTQTHQDEARLTFKILIRACFNYKTLLFSTVYFLTVVNFVSFVIFTPTMIDGFGFSVLTSQLLSAPPFIIQTVMTLLGGYLADKCHNKRGILLVVGFAAVVLGYMLLLVLESRWARFGALFVIATGLGLQAPANIGWSAINFPNLEIRAIAVAVVVMIGNSGGIAASYLYPSTDGPRYIFGNVSNLCCATVGALCAALTSYLLYRENMKMDKLQEQLGKESGVEDDDKARFRYYY